MKRIVKPVTLVCVAVLFVGCGSKDPGPAADSGHPAAGLDEPLVGPGAAGSSRGPNAAVAKASRDPKAVVSAFLLALRNGNEEVAEQLLTSKAREETAKHDLAVKPPGTPNASYEVGQVEYANERQDAAYVHSNWSETYDGVTESFEIIWVLRNEPQGWRVAGMATKLAENEVPLFLNFEDPEEMIRKWQEAETELAEQPGTDANARQAGSGAAAGRPINR